MSYIAYPEYKESGVDWLEEVPQHWDIFRTKSLFEIKKSIAGELGFDVLAITQGGIKKKDLEANTGQFSADYSKYQHVQRGDFAMNHMDLLTGWIDISRYGGVTSPDYRVFNVRETAGLDKRFYLYVFQMAYRDRIYYSLGQGASQLGRWRLPKEQFYNFRIPHPSKNEQRLIAAFLDRETSKIDEAVAAQERLILLLAEKHHALVSAAVTKGIDPDAPMKDSGIEWLGEIPAHWNLPSVWMLFSIGRGRVLSHEDISNNPGPYPVYSSQTANNGILGQIGTYDFEGDYLTWTTDGAHAGTVFHRSGKFNCTNVCGTLKPLKKINLVFAQAAISQASKFFVRQDINPKLMNDVMSGIRITFPPFSEQQQIAEKISALVAPIKEATEKAKSLIALLKKRRSALISAAVTGKIDVRGEIAPEEISKLEQVT